MEKNYDLSIYPDMLYHSQHRRGFKTPSHSESLINITAQGFQCVLTYAGILAWEFIPRRVFGLNDNDARYQFI